MSTRWNPETYPLWHGSVPMSVILNATGPSDMFVRGEGSWLIDKSGKRFLDARAGIANMTLGYSRKDITGAMHQQAQELPFTCTMRYERPTPVVVDLAEALVKAAPNSGLSKVRFVHTGSASVEAALLMARQYQRNLGRNEKTATISLQDSYHGSTLMAMAASGQPGLHGLFSPMPAGFFYAPPPDRQNCPLCLGRKVSGSCTAGMLATIDQVGPDKIAAILVEPRKGLNGQALPHHYLKTLRDLCTKHDILLVFDEVFSSHGRMGPMFVCEESGVWPDIMCVAKGTTAGYAPLGAVLATHKVYEAFDGPDRPYFAHGNSTDAHPVCCAAGLATLRAFAAEDVIARGIRMGGRLGSILANELADCSAVSAVRQAGAFIAIDVVDENGKPAPIPALLQICAAARCSGLKHGRSWC